MCGFGSFAGEEPGYEARQYELDVSYGEKTEKRERETPCVSLISRPLPVFWTAISPQLRDKMWEWPGNELAAPV